MKSNLFLCRLCSSKVKKNLILHLSGMPIAAQHFLDENEINKKDKTIDLEILQCEKCGLVQLDIEPVSYFKSTITATSISGATKKLRLDQMQKLSKKFNLKNKKIIEIGCGTGVMLDIIKEAGMDAYGLEYSDISVNEGLREGRKIIKGYLTEIGTINEYKFDAFICYNFLEHVPNINLFVKSIHNNLKEGGIGLVTVPNLNYLLETKSFYEFVPDHLSYFTKITLQLLFQQNNFEIIECNLINNKNDIQILIKKSKEKKTLIENSPKILELKKDYQEVEKLIYDLQRISKKYKSEGKKIAVWGAGHRTLALLALSKFKDIEFIIDSAKFKQGKYSPVNLTKIVSPEILYEKNIDLLIVMLPGIYPDEVIKTVVGMKLNIKVAKLKDNKIEFILL